jgi:hypothetical protein
MPFITPERRALIEEGKGGSLHPIQPGDRCYMYYKEMVAKWKAEPRWTTAHEIRKHMWLYPVLHVDDRIAEDLAWQVFFQIHVMEYERKKREENGDII